MKDAAPAPLAELPTDPGRHNSFTFLRLGFALAVVVAHSFTLGGWGFDPVNSFTRGHAHLGVVAVLCFFVASGYMIAQSITRHPSIARFFLHRVARIIPGFTVNLLLTVFVLVPVVLAWTLPGQQTWTELLTYGPQSAMDYLAANWKIRIVQYDVSSFAHNVPFPLTVNGSMWSLWPEVVCYGYLALFSVLRLLRFRSVILALFVILYFVQVLVYNSSPDDHGRFSVSRWGYLFLGEPHHRAVFLAFMAGVVCWVCRDRLPAKHLWAGLAATILLFAAYVGLWRFAWPFTLPYLVIYLAARLPFRNWERWGDFSYGIYIYAFPLQQALAAAGLHQQGFLAYMAASLALATGAGWASWHGVERPCLRGIRTVLRKWNLE